LCNTKLLIIITYDSVTVYDTNKSVIDILQCSLHVDNEKSRKNIKKFSNNNTLIIFTSLIIGVLFFIYNNKLLIKKQRGGYESFQSSAGDEKHPWQGCFLLDQCQGCNKAVTGKIPPHPPYKSHPGFGAPFIY